jgi:hypothetical protein
MDYGNRQDTLDRVLAAAGSLDKLIADLRGQAQETQNAIRTAREQEEARFKQAMMAMFREQQQRMETALRPKTARAWQTVAGVSALLVVLFAGWMLLLKQANDRLSAAQARADAAEISADVKEALQRVEITSCGGQPCIRVDKSTPTWKSGKNEYILVGDAGKRR